MHKWLLFLFITSLQVLHAKCLIITHAYNRPDFIELQALTFNRFLQDEYEFVVFNDAEPGPIHDAINQMCHKWKIRSIPIPQEVHDHLHVDFVSIFSGRHADAIHYSLDTLGFDHQDLVVLIDSDLFLIRPLHLKKLVENHEIAAITRPGFIIQTETPTPVEDKHHLWPGLVVMDMPKLPNKHSLRFTPTCFSGFYTDTGGASYTYLQENPEVRLLSLDCYHFGLHTSYKQIPVHPNIPRNQTITAFKNLGFNPDEIWFLYNMPKDITVEFAVNNHFLHYRGASYEREKGWDRSPEYVERKTAFISNFLYKICHKHRGRRK